MSSFLCPSPSTSSFFSFSSFSSPHLSCFFFLLSYSIINTTKICWRTLSGKSSVHCLSLSKLTLYVSWIQLPFIHLFIHKILNAYNIHDIGLGVMMFARQIYKPCKHSDFKELKEIHNYNTGYYECVHNYESSWVGLSQTLMAVFMDSFHLS